MRKIKEKERKITETGVCGPAELLHKSHAGKLVFCLTLASQGGGTCWGITLGISNARAISDFPKTCAIPYDCKTNQSGKDPY